MSPPRPALALGVSGRAIAGQRGAQEDFFRILGNDRQAALVVCDGMGGHPGGAVAARLVCDSFMATLAEVLAGPPDGPAHLRDALDCANLRLAAAQRQDPVCSRMGTTLLAVLVRNDRLTWISVGDSPLWILRKGHLARLNQDHSLRAHPALGPPHALRSSVAGRPIRLVDEAPGAIRLAAGDLVLAASDGMLTLSDAELTRLATTASGAADAVDILLEAVERQAGPAQDNCTLVALAVSPTAPESGAPTVNPPAPASGITRALPLVAGLAAAAGAAALGLWLAGR